MSARQVALVASLILAAALVACAPRAAVTYIPDGGSYGPGDIAGLLASADLGPVVRLTTEDAPAARQDALASLRRHGGDAVDLADSLTSDFPPDVAAVPVIVERGSYAGSVAWFVIEAWGDPGGKLTHRRIWVLSYDARTVVTAQSAL